MAIGQSKLSGDSSINQHRKMGGAGSDSTFGVDRFPARDGGKHPDHTMGKAVTLDEGMRGAKPPIEAKGRRMQANADHGPGLRSAFRYDENA